MGSQIVFPSPRGRTLPITDGLVTATFRDSTPGSEKTRNVTQPRDAHLTQELWDSQGEKSVFRSATLGVFTSRSGCWKIALWSLCQEATWEVWKFGVLTRRRGAAVQPHALRHWKTWKPCVQYQQLEKMTMPYSVLTGFKRQIQVTDPLMGDCWSTKEVVGFQKPAFEMFCVPAQPTRPLQWYFLLYEFPFDTLLFLDVSICEFYVRMRPEQFEM